jgi:hypothetical protein
MRVLLINFWALSRASGHGSQSAPIRGRDFGSI